MGSPLEDGFCDPKLTTSCHLELSFAQRAILPVANMTTLLIDMRSPSHAVCQKYCIIALCGMLLTWLSKPARQILIRHRSKSRVKDAEFGSTIESTHGLWNESGSLTM